MAVQQSGAFLQEGEVRFFIEVGVRIVKLKIDKKVKGKAIQ
jgi:hypothetical protein